MIIEREFKFLRVSAARAHTRTRTQRSQELSTRMRCRSRTLLVLNLRYLSVTSKAANSNSNHRHSNSASTFRDFIRFDYLSSGWMTSLPSMHFTQSGLLVSRYVAAVRYAAVSEVSFR